MSPLPVETFTQTSVVFETDGRVTVTYFVRRLDDKGIPIAINRPTIVEAKVIAIGDQSIETILDTTNSTE